MFFWLIVGYYHFVGAYAATVGAYAGTSCREVCLRGLRACDFVFRKCLRGYSLGSFFFYILHSSIVHNTSTTLCVTRFLSFNVEHLRNTWKVSFSPSRMYGNLQYNLGGFTTLSFFNTNICHIVMLQPGFPAFRWFMHVKFHIHLPKIFRRISELWWWLRMERFQPLLFWGGSNTAKAPEPMLQVARGWAPHRWQAGCGSFCFRKGLQCKNAQWYLLGEVSQGKHRIEKPKHHNRRPKKSW